MDTTSTTPTMTSTTTISEDNVMTTIVEGGTMSVHAIPPTTTTVAATVIIQQHQQQQLQQQTIDNHATTVVDQFIKLQSQPGGVEQWLSTLDKQQLSTTDGCGRTLLYVATSEQNYDAVRQLIKQGADVNQSVRLYNIGTQVVSSNTPFSLLNYTYPASEETVLHLASRNGDHQMLTLLVESGANKEAQDSLRRTPYVLAAANGRTECSRLLILSGVNVNAVDCYNKTALHLAIDQNHEDISTTITRNGGDLSVRYHYNPHAKANMLSNDIETGQGKEHEIEIIEKLDRYGHITDQNQVQTKKDSEREARLIELELSRAQKWWKMMRSWTPGKKRPSKVAERSIKGIPDRVRGQAWRLLSNSDINKLAQPNLYGQLLDQPSASELVIDLDVNRASRNYIYFRERYGHGQVALFNVLKVYSNFDQEIGYTQGMSSIAALLVMYMPETDAFWTFERLMNGERYNMRHLFVTGLIKLHQMIYVFDKLLAKKMPSLSKHFTRINLGSVLFATKWFIIGYLDTLPFYLILRTWDLIFSEGYNIVYAVAITLLRHFEGQLVGKPFEECFQVFQQLERLEMDQDEFVASVMKNVISNKKIEKLEREYQASQNVPPPSSRIAAGGAGDKKSRRSMRFASRK
ncbi:hypothetical protein SAMD00019534_023450 [Acytostelium subglobosum LB1]|uniref:hypothetical protein n=1 Tax=Acytostelium subglobosum LB1 TaxID=1410327 RepID=UPI000645132B|nr:hypothetical protein SAMD00019534_023450 [Acytostelium subglobosum LB1]GAM19170.1 hypothetical protein SAMD00019534_023450 [Acytostelium subglobosum LB1]|eukprot:XP_012757097.1 hypothetical protein SAMD00019534_023450 [Acytostelium subglobosum LB1]